MASLTLSLLFAVFLPSAVLCGTKPHYDFDDDFLKKELAIIIFRHGDRAPDKMDLLKGVNQSTLFPYGLDNLDMLGRINAYNLGKHLRKLYKNLIGEEYIPGVVNITTPDLSRDQLSAQVLAAGLLPPSSNQKWGLPGEIGDLWQPIFLDVVPLEHDDWLHLEPRNCPAMYEERAKINKSPPVVGFLNKHSDLVKAVQNHTADEPTLYYLSNLYSTLEILDRNNLSMPAWTKPFYPKDLLDARIMQYRAHALTRRMQRITGGKMLGKMINAMEDRIHGSPLRMWLMSSRGHIVSKIGMTTRVWGYQYPSFDSALIYELLSDPHHNYFVKVMFHNDTTKLPATLKVEGCEELCPFEKFKSILRDVIPVNLEEECRVSGMTL